MATKSDSSLRLVNVSRDLLENSDTNAHSTFSNAHDRDRTSESSARGDAGEAVAGEIRNDWNLARSPSETLLGVPGFSASGNATPQLDPQKLFVSPETVKAIEKAKRRGVTEPTI